MKTSSITTLNFKKNWHQVDATDQTLGRLAVQIARLLRGKHKPCFTPHVDCGDYVVVTNAAKIKLTGQKWSDKQYYHHTGYIGGLKTSNAAALRSSKPEKLISLAVKGMLPKNKLARKIFTHLRVYPGAEHPHQGQTPTSLTV